MTQEPSTLYAKLLGETAEISWKELEPFFAKGALLWVDAKLDLIEAAEGMAEDNRGKVAAWLAAGALAKCLRRGHWTWLSVIPACGRWWFRRGF